MKHFINFKRVTIAVPTDTTPVLKLAQYLVSVGVLLTWSNWNCKGWIERPKLFFFSPPRDAEVTALLAWLSINLNMKLLCPRQTQCRSSSVVYSHRHCMSDLSAPSGLNISKESDIFFKEGEQQTFFFFFSCLQEVHLQRLTKPGVGTTLFYSRFLHFWSSWTSCSLITGYH